jgi:hypothetical protein
MGSNNSNLPQILIVIGTGQCRIEQPAVEQLRRLPTASRIDNFTFCGDRRKVLASPERARKKKEPPNNAAPSQNFYGFLCLRQTRPRGRAGPLVLLSPVALVSTLT